ncbi:hypothetical protein BJX63DRAFT_427051 [Aspergillus granulosus]|uniref:Uncharacterized protein n=1 Tax=Aspergillus granulosus TaxID=176169 RepID=A0ABR4I401_9EURO
MQQISEINLLVYYAPHAFTTNIGMEYGPSLHVGSGLRRDILARGYILPRRNRVSIPAHLWYISMCLLFFLRGHPTNGYYSCSSQSISLPYGAISPSADCQSQGCTHQTYAAALAGASDWIFNYLIVRISPIATDNIRWKT